MSPSSSFNQSRRAFTLIELLVVIAIIAVLAALSLSVFGRMKEKANQAKCMHNLRQLNVGISLYAADHDSELPYYKVTSTPDELSGSYWHRRIQSYVQAQFGGSGANATALYICPSDKAPYANALSYAMNSQLAGLRLGGITNDPVFLIEAPSISITGEADKAGDPKNPKIKGAGYNHSNQKMLHVLRRDGSVTLQKTIPSLTDDPTLWKPNN